MKQQLEDDEIVATTGRNAVPNPEWVLMYRSGLSRARIAGLTGNSPSTVGYHLRAARAADPGLGDAHEKAAGRKTGKVTYQGLDRMKDLIAAVQATGRYPVQNASDLSERTRAAWLKRRRSEARAGTLAPAYREGLSVLPNWEGTPRTIFFRARWQNRLRALTAYLAAGNDWPLYQGTTGEEHELGIWLHRQRIELHRGQLDPGKADALNSAVPGWRTGRKRGSKADEAKWHDRLAALAAYRAAGHDWPLNKAKPGSQEHQLGVWLQAQRNRHRSGKLTPARTEELNTTVPGWRTGRPHGKKRQIQWATKPSAPIGNIDPDSKATA